MHGSMHICLPAESYRVCVLQICVYLYLAIDLCGYRSVHVYTPQDRETLHASESLWICVELNCANLCIGKSLQDHMSAELCNFLQRSFVKHLVLLDMHKVYNVISTQVVITRELTCYPNQVTTPPEPHWNCKASKHCTKQDL